MTTWGLVATIKAPASDILKFSAYHLEAGAHRLYIYLDAENPQAQQALSDHPKVRVLLCDDAYWQGKRPKKHQVRQTQNATHAYHRAADVDWLIHMDVDEFLVSAQPVDDILAQIPADTATTRIRPMEVLSGDGTAFKAFIPNGPKRDQILADLYPTYGHHLKGGFLSHLAGKVFVRTGLEELQVRIHNVLQSGDILQGIENQPGIDLAHCHAKSWEQWRRDYAFRLDKGSYRADLNPNRPRQKGGVTNHELFQAIVEEEGEAGLQSFFDEVCADTPDLRARLQRHGLLKRANLGLNATLATQFPAWRA